MRLELDLPPKMSSALRKVRDESSKDVDYLVKLMIYLWLTSNGYLELDTDDEEFIHPDVEYEFT